MIRLLPLLLLFCHSLLFAAGGEPESLAAWKPWIAEAHPDLKCPIAQAKGHRDCAWPGTLQLGLDAQGGQFRMNWQVAGRSIVPLPGGRGQWPVEVTVDGRPHPVIHQGDRPALLLEPGSYEVEGRFAWDGLPNRLMIPERIVLLDLRLGGKPVDNPLRQQGALVLGGKRGPSKRPALSSLHLSVFRLVRDDQPLFLDTRIELQVTGEPREVVLGRPLPEHFLPMRLNSGLPARIDPEGRLHVQVKAGRWTVQLEAYANLPLDSLSPPANTTPWPRQEIWSFRDNPPLRLVRLTGAPSLDPQQTRLPGEWKGYPAYLITPKTTLAVEVLRRGDATPPADQLTLERVLWLDFDGEHFTAQDRIHGQLHRHWRLETTPELALGHVRIEGHSRPITRLPDSGIPGIEVRHGALDLVAESSIARNQPTTVSGWTLPFQRVATELRLPPGWKLLAAGGVEQENGSWLSRWRVYDLFLLFVIAVGAGKLWGWTWTPLTLITLGWVWHEFPWLQGLWLLMLIFTALRRALPTEGRLPRFLARLWMLGALALVVGVAVLMIEQARSAFYPQLENREWTGGAVPVMADKAPSVQGLAESTLQRKSLMSLGKGRVATSDALAKPPEQEWMPEPDARIQTGPGLPQWRWRSAYLNWNGPVHAGQALELYLLSPGWTRVLRLLSLPLLGLLLWRFLWTGLPRLRMPSSSAAGLLLIALVGAGGAMPPQTAFAADDGAVHTPRSAPGTTGGQTGFPPEYLLRELERRMLEPPECQPGCIDIESMRLELEQDRMRIHLDVHAAASVSFPLPMGDFSPRGAWRNGAPAPVLRNQGRWWSLAEKGVQRIVVEARLSGIDRLVLALPLPPHRVTVTGRGWTVDGLRPDGTPSAQLTLSRVGQAARPEQRGAVHEQNTLEPLARLTRTFRLGRIWQVEYRLERLSPRDRALTFALPLLQGEQVLDERFRAKDGKLQLVLAANAQAVSWSSRLPIGDSLALTALRQDRLVETWKLAVTPDWHYRIGKGIPPVHALSQGRIIPEFRPWPGESLEVAMIRPQPVPGPVLTILESKVMLRPGHQNLNGTLDLKLRAGKGLAHGIALPAGARLTRISRNRQDQPVRQKGQEIALVLQPGEQHYHLEWETDDTLATLWQPEPVDLNNPAVNAETRIRVPEDRWVLFALGPVMGPAVLFWSSLLLVMMFALALGRLRNLTPLGTTAWFLLGLGLMQASLIDAGLVVLTLLALGARSRLDPRRIHLFNLLQAGLLILVIVGIYALFAVIQQGLLGQPDMRVTGNLSDAHNLVWYQDRVDGRMPDVTLVSAPLWLWRTLMLAWSLWLAFSVVRWSRWAWESYGHGGYWRPLQWRERLRNLGKRSAS